MLGLLMSLSLVYPLSMLVSPSQVSACNIHGQASVFGIEKVVFAGIR